MDSRSFIIGLVCGVVVGALAVWLIHSGGGNDVLSVEEREAHQKSIPELVNVAPPVEVGPQELRDESNPNGNDLQPKGDATGEPVAPWPENLRAELELEPKDDSWAYYMEQTLLQYLSAHPSIEQFDITSIECRTAKCQIAVFGFDDNTVPVWSQVIYDIRQQPWSEFGQYGYSTGNVGERLKVVSTLHRETDPE